MTPKQLDTSTNPLWLWSTRLKRYITQEEIAKALKVERRTVYGWIHGTSTPNPDNDVSLKAYTNNKVSKSKLVRWKKKQLSI
jgi:transcriptional regulator with XRE-family HTH domain